MIRSNTKLTGSMVRRPWRVGRAARVTGRALRLAGTAAALTVLAAPACDAPDRPAGEWGGSVDTLPGGTVLVSNPAQGLWGEGEAWRLAEDLRIGSLEGDGDDVFGQIRDLEVDAEGRIHVLEGQSDEIRIFAPDGEHLRTVAGTGGGPEELDGPLGLAWHPHENTLWVVDAGNGRFSVFSAEGDFLESHRRDAAGISLPWRGRFQEDGRLVDQVFIPGAGGGLARLDRDLEWADTVRVSDFTDFEPEFWSNAEGTVRAGIPFQPSMVSSIDPRGSLWWGLNDEFRFVHGTFQGDTLRVIEKAWEPRPVPDEAREEALEGFDWFTQQGGELRARDIPSRMPAYSWLRPADDGTLWVARYEWGAGLRDRFHVFDPDGRYLGEAASDAGVASNPLVFRDGYLYGVTRDELDVQYVVRLRIEDPGSGGG